MRLSRFSELVKCAGRRAASAALATCAILGAQTEDLGQIRDIAPPVEMPPDPLWPLYIRYAAVGLAAIAAGVYVWYRRRVTRLAAEAAEAARPRPPHEVALERLDALEASLPRAGEPSKPFYTELTDALRGYVSGRFGVEAEEQTTAELMASLSAVSELSEEHRGMLAGLFAEADLVKFASSTPPEGAAREAVRTGRGFVSETAAVEAIHVG